MDIDYGFLKNNRSKLHFVGIGGSGTYPLVQILNARGFDITGSDNNESSIIELERAMNIPVSIGHKAENVSGRDIIIYSAAITQDNVELVRARELGIPCYKRAQLLGLVSSWFGDAFCISGTHGKTTTTALLTSILVDCCADPSAVIGGKLDKIGGYGRVGSGSALVLEACEFADTFLSLSPDYSVILNIDADHLDYFGTLENLIASFKKFARLASKKVIINGDDANTVKAVANEGLDLLTFGEQAGNIYRAVNITPLKNARYAFDIEYEERLIAGIILSVPGRHNVINALAACVCALQAGVPADMLAGAVKAFTGAGRRFEILGEKNGVIIADDYAHHPAEITTTLRAAKDMGYKRVWAVHQPFTYSRTAMLLDDFAEALSIADKVVLSEIMGGRESNTYNIHAKDLAEKIDGCVWFEGFAEIARYVMDNAGEGDLVLTLGCGDVYKCAKMMLAL